MTPNQQTRDRIARAWAKSKSSDFFRDFDSHWKEAREAVRRAERAVRYDLYALIDKALDAKEKQP